MNYFRIKNWEKYQHYKDRNPPWIKLHTELLDNYEFSCLQDASKLLAFCIMLLAARSDNKIPGDSAWIKSRCNLSAEPDLDPLFASGFVEFLPQETAENAPASNTLAERKQSACSEERRGETETERKSGSPVFAEIRNLYPKRSGSQRWQDAESAFKARVREGHSPEEILDGVKRYVAFVKAEGNEGSSFVQQAATFLGTNKGFLEDWKPPEKLNGSAKIEIRKDPYRGAI